MVRATAAAGVGVVLLAAAAADAVDVGVVDKLAICDPATAPATGSAITAAAISTGNVLFTTSPCLGGELHTVAMVCVPRDCAMKV